MDLAICQHIKMGGGERCGSPAMRGQRYCYFHAGAHRTIPSVNLWPTSKAGTLRQSLGRLSDADHHNVPWQRCKFPGEAADIQLGFARLIQGVTQGLLNVRQAKIILAALHRAVADQRTGTATGDSAVTSNELQLPTPVGCGSFTSESQRG